MPEGITLAGRGSLRADGKVYNCTRIDPAIGNEKREKLSGLGGVAGDKVTPVAPKCDATIIVTPDVSVAALGMLQNIVLEVSMADGRNYVFIGASVTEPPKHSATDGTCDVSFEALAGMEV